MIDWQVHVEGTALTGGDGERLGGYFPSQAYQDFLLPFFDIGAQEIDELGSWRYRGEDLRFFITKLTTWLDRFDPHVEKSWRVETFGDGLQRLEVKEVIRLLENAIAAAKSALAKEGDLVFFGD